MNFEDCKTYLAFTEKFLNSIDITTNVKHCNTPTGTMEDIENEYRDYYKNYCNICKGENTLPKVVEEHDSEFDKIFNVMSSTDFEDYVRARYGVKTETRVETFWVL